MELMDPSPAVRTHFVTLPNDFGRELRCPFEGDCRGGDRRLDAVLRKEPHHAWSARLDAVPVVRLVAEVADRLLEGNAEFIHRFGAAVTVRDRRFGALFDIDDDGQREAGLIGPAVRGRCHGSSDPAVSESDPKGTFRRAEPINNTIENTDPQG